MVGLLLGILVGFVVSVYVHEARRRQRGGCDWCGGLAACPGKCEGRIQW